MGTGGGPSTIINRNNKGLTMAQKRGRASTAELSIAAVKIGDRPEPPMSLNPRAEDEWRRVVDRMPSDWFGDETLSLLQSYCEHVAEGEAIQMMVEKVRKTAMADDESYKRYRDLLRDKELQTRAALSCATKMRLTQQASYNAKSASTAQAKTTGGLKPWQR